MRWKNLFFITGIVGANILVDQVTKFWAVATIQGQEAWRFLGDFIVITYAENRGAFLGFLSDAPEWLRLIGLIIVPLVACVAGYIYLVRTDKFTLGQILALASALGGGISNLVDRLRFGYVVDFLNFGVGPVVRTGILNVADLSLTFGLVAYLVLSRKKAPKQGKET